MTPPNHPWAEWDLPTHSGSDQQKVNAGGVLPLPLLPAVQLLPKQPNSPVKAQVSVCGAGKGQCLFDTTQIIAAD